MIDVAKAANALSRPRIDPRKFVDTGIVTAVDVTSDGVHVDITTQDGLEETAAVSPPYGGPGYGFHLPIDLDRVALVAIPDGVYNSGARVIGTAWDAGDPPPKDVIDNPDDVVLVVKPGQTMRIIVTGGGNVLIEARDGGTVQLGQPESGLDPRTPALSTIDGGDFIDALSVAIAAQSLNPQGQAALQALKTALDAKQWPTGRLGVLVK